MQKKVNKYYYEETRRKMSLNSSLIYKKEDTGSTESQVAFLTNIISKLTSHLKLHPKDYSSQRGLWKLLGKRKRLLRYLSRKDMPSYTRISTTLGIRKS
uniref:Small ribosomal subunit protein uS15c n=1 Tax=Trichomanes trollii TaxID=1481379 RepID=A0A410YEM8_9MONI|nr:ribosomal protein S15 [Trichomanes trollii]QAV57628.1 ribosomal protein S15 [Trichomanes trollii]